ncbi:helix-turn-helix domain-containing protein [Microbacterium sp. SORGH_AS_0888]|uniref:helix-turn-helix domain-containing protein n=1 Tax=Microbacterium sp. SORGH_AS_0888 TaxID=3041791 RepID=UPI002787EC71|nr:helix-turn-helix domain-containing protein [Microbacterium sp. SORGH_AS_0888]MDQ1128026.1 hypothetical protein [Microbacterium sp. SORGH_AS_0888]
MQELLGRLGALDPEARQSLRVIACFDELMSGNVPTRALLAAAAALCGGVVGAQYEGRVERIDRRGDRLGPDVGVSRRCVHDLDGLRVWVEGEAPAHANDALVLERLALAIRVRVDPFSEGARRRDLAVVLDAEVAEGERLAAAARLLLPTDARFRVVVAPLFTAWERHPQGIEDVVATPAGPVHVAVIGESVPEPAGAPVGIGVAASVAELPVSYRTALVAVRLHDGRSAAPVRADDLGGLAVMLAEQFERGLAGPDQERVSRVAAHSWGESTLDALVRTTSLREAARDLGIHPSTLSARVESIVATLGFDPLTGLGRTRLGTAFLLWRLRQSRVLDVAAR